MSTCFYNTRVIHKPADYCYEVSVKKHWYSKWEFRLVYTYYKDKPGFGCTLSQENAKQYAIRDAENFSEWNVVYDKRRLESWRVK